MVIEQDKWIIQAREGFAVAGEIIELRDENNALMNVQNLSAALRIIGWNRNEEFSTVTGNFVTMPPVSPATYPTAWEFKLSAVEVESLKLGNNDFELLFADQIGVFIGSITGVIEKRK